MVPGYEPLMAVLVEAFDQAANGKGKERHADSKPFDQQPMQDLIRLYGQGFALGQAAKKSQESQRLPYERARAELLGAIVYTAGAILALDRQNCSVTPVANDNTEVSVGAPALVLGRRVPKARPKPCRDCTSPTSCRAVGFCDTVAPRPSKMGTD